eukprot:7261614-Prymnesium_polylepis.1
MHTRRGGSREEVGACRGDAQRPAKRRIARGVPTKPCSASAASHAARCAAARSANSSGGARKSLDQRMGGQIPLTGTW